MNSIMGNIFSEYGSWIITIVTALLLAKKWLHYIRKSKSKYPLPPGPKGYPIIGNFSQVPPKRSDLQYAKWTKEYGEQLL